MVPKTKFCMMSDPFRGCNRTVKKKLQQDYRTTRARMVALIVGHRVGPGHGRAAVPCPTVLWARPSAHDTAHGPFTRAVPAMAHNHFRRVVPAHGTTHMDTGGGGGKVEKEVGEGLREKEWPTRCRGHRSRDGELKANGGRRRRIGSDESERGTELRMRGRGSDLGLGMGRGGRRLYMGMLCGGVV
jgi:hypothetical protein